jgi:hypothetical protein
MELALQPLAFALPAFIYRDVAEMERRFVGPAGRRQRFWDPAPSLL